MGNFDDIQDSWSSVERTIDYYGDNQDIIIANAGPGHWNDPDMLIIGNFGLSYEQCKTQMAMWAIFAAPLLMSVDLRTLKPDYKAILKNKKIINVNQDLLGIQGRRIYKQKGIEIWARPIMPVYRAKYSYAIVFLNRRTDGTPSEVSVTLKELGLDNPTGYHIEDLYDEHVYGVVTPDRRLKVDVNPSGSVVMIRCDIKKGKQPVQQSLNKPPWDAAPRAADGFVLDQDIPEQPAAAGTSTSLPAAAASCLPRHLRPPGPRRLQLPEHQRAVHQHREEVDGERERGWKALSIVARP